MNAEDIGRRLREELETILARPLAEGDEQRPLHELGVDSIGLVELLVAIEREFKMPLLEAGLAADDFRTLARLAEVIHARLP